jgi:hypothetical protein
MSRSPYAAELDAQHDSAMIKMLSNQIDKKGYGRNEDRARIDDLIAERDAQGLSDEERKVLAERIIKDCDQLIQDSERPQVEDRRAAELARGDVTVTRAEHPDSAGRRWIKTQWGDGYSETLIFENDQEWAEYLTNEIHGEAALENERRELVLERIPEDLRPLVNDPEGLFKVMQDQGKPVEERQQIVKSLRPAMRKVDYERLSALAFGDTT